MLVTVSTNHYIRALQSRILELEYNNRLQMDEIADLKKTIKEMRERMEIMSEFAAEIIDYAKGDPE